ncbi:hypothetical protein MY04_3250 [Flammeovirga sp. MY04]|uniref:hypothetical protein n=1 Tax=Flammeovirga sp. MY04 TaxID=1191459 RepID=UPI000806306F|nr:hypothetical protein [Flammeovirga sp. MY04]ANQ50615.1 hypothetical protein MY04_3250 [Flammeovirga sp. MY04]
MKKIYIIIQLLFLGGLTFAQNTEEVIDASKPTNFYSQMDIQFEHAGASDQYGLRNSFIIAPSEKHLILGELPILHNTRTGATGIGDVRLRYFYLPYKNYDKLLGAFGPSIDVYAPTGNVDKGLGNGRWVVAPGLTLGVMAFEKVQFFPIISYQYMSEKAGMLNENGENVALHGMTFQVITPIVFSPKMYVQVTPIVQLPDFRRAETNVACEVLLAYSIREKIQLSGFYKADKTYGQTFRVGTTLFF